ncbi:hypothetical protein TWF173_011557 [Orbilia oligospora]|nr:hypothetical protein TWF173_011557 [Orbilia oligospora]
MVHFRAPGRRTYTCHNRRRSRTLSATSITFEGKVYAQTVSSGTFDMHQDWSKSPANFRCVYMSRLEYGQVTNLNMHGNFDREPFFVPSDLVSKSILPLVSAMVLSSQRGLSDRLNVGSRPLTQKVTLLMTLYRPIPQNKDRIIARGPDVSEDISSLL